MGQPVHLMVFASSEQHGLDACAAALRELRRVEARLTLFDDGSELSELNRRAGRGAMRLGSDLRAILGAGERTRQRTGGAFNLAIEPLMRAWGFHRPRPTAPSAAELDEARDAVQSAVIELDGDRVRLPASHTRLDPGSIGVGYGIDRALGVLQAHGIRRAFLDVSGDCAALDPPPGEAGWLVGVADPADRNSTVAETRIHNAALATAANTESRVRYGALLAGHVMDPATGWPARKVAQATVLADTATAADALSTAAFVRPGSASWGIHGSWLVSRSEAGAVEFPN